MLKYVLFGSAIITLILVVWVSVTHNSKTPVVLPHACTAEAKLCPDGTTVERAGPNCEFAECPIVHELPTNDATITVDTPRPNSVVTSPLIISGKARGTWFFEGSFPIVIVDSGGHTVGQGIATAEGEWMTAELVPFSARISYTLFPNTLDTHGYIILKKDNPSGLQEHDDSRTIPVIFTKVSQK